MLFISWDKACGTESSTLNRLKSEIDLTYCHYPTWAESSSISGAALLATFRKDIAALKHVLAMTRRDKTFTEEIEGLEVTEIARTFINAVCPRVVYCRIKRDKSRDLAWLAIFDIV